MIQLGFIFENYTNIITRAVSHKAKIVNSALISILDESSKFSGNKSICLRLLR